MKHLTRLPLFVLFLVTTAVAAGDRSAPDGWRFPAKEDQKDGWVTFAEPGRCALRHPGRLQRTHWPAALRHLNNKRPIRN